MTDESEYGDEFWQGVDTVNVAQPDGGSDDDPYEETGTIPGVPLGVTFRELHAFAYGLVPAFMAFVLFGQVHEFAWLGIVALGVAAAFGFRKIPSATVNRAVVRDPAWFLGGVLVGVPLGGALHALFDLVGVF